MDPAKTVAQDPMSEFVSVLGVVHRVSSFGVFLELESRRVFVPILRMQPPARVLQPGETVTLHVSRSYAEQEMLVP